MKRIICLALCALAAALSCACGNDNAATPTQAQPQSDTTAAIETQEAQPATEDGETLSLKAFINTFDTTPEVAEALVYEDEALSVTVNSIDYSPIAGPQLLLTVENRSDQNLIVQAPYAVVNGYMVSPEMELSAEAGKSAAGGLTLPYFNLAISGITTLQTIEFSLRAVEAESYEPIIAKTELIEVQTTADQSAETPCDESGQIAYDEDDVKIILKGVNTDRAYSDGAELTVYLYNGTDRSIAIQSDDVIVNGYDMTSVMNRTLLPGKRAVDVVTIYTLDMEEYGIEEIDSVEVSFEIKDADSWETIAATDLITVDPPQTETTAETENATVNS